jgi:membrane-associated protease RseP (regulator of RpoE activity)
MNSLLFWFLLLVAFIVMYALGQRAGARRVAAEGAAKEPPLLPSAKLTASEAKLAPFMAITGHRVLGEAVEFDGHLRGDAEAQFEAIRGAFAGDPVTPMLLEGEQGQSRVLLLPLNAAKAAGASKPRWGVHALLFLATLATTTWAGALHAGVNLLQDPAQFGVGLPYSLGLLLILGAHELGHYFTAKVHGIDVTPPFFIPVPFALGTFGAFIRIKSLSPDRRALFDVAVAGPLAGLVFAIPALLFGLRLSQVIPGEVHTGFGVGGVDIDSSILLALLAKISLGTPMTGGGHLVLHPLAFAGWLGLVVTALNLIPIGQLDGGHIAHAQFGSRKAHGIGIAALILLFALALFVWPGLLMWAFIVYFIAGTRDMPAANDVTPIGTARQLLGYFAFLLLLLIIAPVPHSLHEIIGIHSRYV